MKNIHFHNVEYFYLLIIIPLLVVLYFWIIQKQRPKIMHSAAGFIKLFPVTKIKYFQHIPFFLLILSLVGIIISLARPQSSSTRKEINTEGIDIVVAIDVSTSMLAEDVKPNRIEAAKETAKEFIKKRPNDRIGLVIFSGESYTQCPVTIDHSVLLNLIDKIKAGMIVDGTAIGMGLATSISRLKDSKAKSKVVILLTDGVNNTGIISPRTATDIAQTFGIKVYTIGLGTKGMAPYPVKTPFGTQYQYVDVKIDDQLLTYIAQSTSGKYFRATNRKSLEKIYSDIDSMEKTTINVSYFTKKQDHYFQFLAVSVLLFTLSILLRLTLLRRLP